MGFLSLGGTSGGGGGGNADLGTVSYNDATGWPSRPTQTVVFFFGGPLDDPPPAVNDDQWFRRLT